MKKLITTCFFVFAMLIISMYSYAETFSVNGTENVSISGKITQFSSTGMSLNDIVIDVKGTKNIQVKTGRSGSYIVSGLPKGGTYTLTPSKPGYTFQPTNKVFRNLDESKVSQDFVAELATYSISGKVIVGGRPVRGVLITINNRPIKYYTDQDGKYVIDNLEYNGGPYEVSVVSDKHIFEPFKIDYLESDVVHDFRKDISISGRVTSLGQGLGGIEIDVNGAKYKTDDDGYYKIDSVISNGDYVVKVVEEKYNPVPSSVPLKKVTSDKYDVNFALTGQLIGKVTYNGQPFKNVIITVSDREQEYKTNAQGMFNVPNLGLNQYYQISLSSAGYKFTPKERIINCLMRESSYQNFKAEIEKYSITVSVNQGKQPLENVEITVSNNTTVYKTDKNGVCTIKDLNYGKKYIVTAKKQGVTFVDSKKIIDKLQGDERVSFEAKLSISGKVLNKTKPLKDAVITCGDKKVTTNANGEYIFTDLTPSQNYTLKVSSKNFVFDKEENEIVNLYDKLENVNFVVTVDKKEQEELSKKAEAEKQAKLKEEEEAKAKAEAEKKAKEEQARLDAEKKKLEAEEKAKAAEEAKAKAEAEKQAKIEAAKAEQARIKAEKEEAARKAKEEKIRAKLEAEEAARKAKEDKEREIAEAKAKAEAEKQAKIKEAEEAKAKIEAEKKAKEEQARLDAEIKRLEAEEKAKAAEEAKAKAEAEKQAKIEAAKAAKEEQARIKAEKEEAERKAKEEKIRAKLEAEEAARKAKEDKEREIAEAKAKAEAEKQAKIEAAKAEQARIKAEKEEAERKAKEEKERKIAEAKAKAEAEKQAKLEEQARIKAEK
ncbi:MAG: hypothetical protein IKN42_06510, partial [Elusimicrobia bacterium]|nr:hypothetical protein [Elusimicrobiota bacterium]